MRTIKFVAPAKSLPLIFFQTSIKIEIEIVEYIVSHLVPSLELTMRGLGHPIDVSERPYDGRTESM